MKCKQQRCLAVEKSAGSFVVKKLRASQVAENVFWVMKWLKEL